MSKINGFMFAMGGYNEDAVRNCTDQAQLAQIAKTHLESKMREVAVCQLTDQSMLADVAKNAKDFGNPCWKTRMAAAERLDDKELAQSIYADIAKNNEDEYFRLQEPEMRIAAIAHLTDQSVLADVAKNAKWPFLGEKEDPCWETRIAATERLTDQSVLTDLAKNAENSTLRVTAAERLDDKVLAQQIYADVVKNSKGGSDRKMAAEKLDDKVLAKQMEGEIECALEREKEREKEVVREFERDIEGIERELGLKSKVDWYHLLFSVNFEGRAQRTEYWLFVLYAFVFNVAITVLDFLPDIPPIIKIGYHVMSLWICLAGIGISVRRLHDIGKSGWMLLVGLIPLIGTIWLFVLYLKDSQPGTNEYGPNPKGVKSI